MNEIGKNIAQLRKAKGITQETLAEVVGVSGQAVSKWEGGGLPDVVHLPVIADYFGVSVDSLFGRKTGSSDIHGALAIDIAETHEKDILRKIMEYCWTMQTYAFKVLGNAALKKPLDSIELVGLESLEDKWIYSMNLVDYGISMVGFNKELPYFLVMPEPECGWGKRLCFDEKYVEFFKALSDTDILRTLLYFYTRENWNSFTPKLLERELGIEIDKAAEILAWMKQYKMVHTTDIEVDDEVQTVYTFQKNMASIVPFLTFAQELIDRPNSFHYFLTARNMPILRQV